MSYIDTHAHLNFEAFKEDYKEVIKRSFDNDVEGIINIGTRFDNSKKAVEIAEEFAKGQTLGKVYAAIGFHPDHLDEVQDIDIEIIKYRKLAKNPKVVAIGEIGLDNYYFRSGKLEDTRDNHNKAEKIFEKFLELAKEVELPVIIHSREAETETLSQLSSVKGQLSKGGVVHCFSGSLDFAKKILDLGFFIGFTGIVTYPPRRSSSPASVKTSSGRSVGQDNIDNLEDVVKEFPIEKILVETDCPFLAPQKYRGKRCEPWYVQEIAKKIAEIKGISQDMVAEITTKNAKNLFKIMEEK